MTVYLAPGRPDALMSYQSRYEHWIGGEAVRPAGGQYFENPTPITGQPFCEVARGTAADVERALDAAQADPARPRRRPPGKAGPRRLGVTPAVCSSLPRRQRRLEKRQCRRAGVQPRPHA